MPLIPTNQIILPGGAMALINVYMKLIGMVKKVSFGRMGIIIILP
jgi:hypothetical protein